MTETNPQTPSPGSIPQKKQLNRITGVLVVVVVVFAALAMWWLSHRDADIKHFAESFIHEMDQGNLTSAQARCTSEVDAAEMKRLSDRMVNEWGEIQLLDLHTRHVSADRIDVAGQLEYQNDLRKTFTATILKQADGSMKISSYKFE